jgi:ubiquinone/menaquinone biosynthesis C-methylase UbiE
MTNSAARVPRPDYGIDAPGVVRNLFIVGATGLTLWASAALGLWSGRLGEFNVRRIGLTWGLSFTAGGLWMVWGSKVDKLREREQMLDLVPWTGHERALDVGCGRGLMLVGAAKRLTDGKATGIDIWQAEDLSGNVPEAATENARREGVADRVEVVTSDMRKMPFADGTFDVAVSNAAIHNIYERAGRDQAIAEIARVLKPGGRAVISDIRHGREYMAAFAKYGCPEVRRLGSPKVASVVAAVTFGKVEPTLLVAGKAAAKA